MAAPALRAAPGWPGLSLGVLCAVWRLPGLSQVRWSRYGPEFRDPLTDKEHYRRPEAELTEEEKHEQELKKTQPIKAAPSTKTSSVFADPVISKFTNMMMRGGNKVLARSLMNQALKNCEPVIGLVPILRGGHFYQVPAPIADRRRRFLAMKWMITECREKKHRRTLMPEKLSHELLEAFNNQGPVIKRKHDMHKMAEANRALAHYRWW
ncbi:28S ribosomal protein S7, mitochondrial isoform X2 [Dipodomys spectabilis]|uniref:28S ribosomal protein S7, mitochondrial isoform X2 n=1 Tax=Dipodomys spectabilis TaxID=105255 RepID=UPI001C538C3C|nr:28S ribosomal protein S7, mitochondrial isoform X2 [Dipodomys spectabilis]